MDGTSISRIPLTGAHVERGARAPHKRQTPSRRHPLSVLSVLEKDAQIDRTERDQQQAASGGRRPGSPGSACGELNGARSAETVRLDPDVDRTVRPIPSVGPIGRRQVPLGAAGTSHRR